MIASPARGFNRFATNPFSAVASRAEEAEKLLRDGLEPSRIAARMGVGLKTVFGYLRRRVGQGSLRFSDIYFSIPTEKRAALQKFEASGIEDHNILEAEGVSKRELIEFTSLRTPRVFAGDLYEYISDIEVELHSFVKQLLSKQYGSDEYGWWRQGVPERIRVKCVKRREEDDEPAEDPFAYTDLIDLSKVLSKNWPLFKQHFPSAYADNRKCLQRDLSRVNLIRNAVMHPVKQKKWTEADFEFILVVKSRLPGSEQSYTQSVKCR